MPTSRQYFQGVIVQSMETIAGAMAKTETIKLRLRPDEKLAFNLAAENSGLALSAWIRSNLREAAARELLEAEMAVPFHQRRARKAVKKLREEEN